MKTSLTQKILLISVVSIFVQSLMIAQNDEITKITSVIDLTMLQIELNLAASNGKPDIIEIGEGVFDLSALDQNLSYYPLPYPKATQEEQYPITIVGAGVGKTIFDAGKSSRRFQISTSQLKNDMGADVTIKGITFRNGRSGSDEPGLAITTKKSAIEVRECEFLSTRGSSGSTLVAITGTDEGAGFIRVISCKFDSLRRTVKLVNTKTRTYVEESKFTNFRDYPALEISNNLGVSYISKCTFMNNRTTREAPLNALAFSNGTIEINECKFENNQGTMSGAVRVAGREANVSILKSSFTGNAGGKGGGGALISMDGSGKIIVDGNLFTENHNDTQGGGIGIITGGNKDAGVTDSKAFIGVYTNIFSKNRTAGDGGGVYIETQQGKVEIINNTIVENSTLYYPKCNSAAGLCLKTISNNASALIYNNIIWKNNCKSKAGIDLLIDNDPDVSSIGWILEPDGIGSEVFVSNNIVGNDNIKIIDNTKVENQLNVDPLLDSNFKLKLNSPAIDAGTSLGHGILGTEDFEGKTRPMDGDGDGKKVVDIGAFEFKEK